MFYNNNKKRKENVTCAQIHMQANTSKIDGWIDRKADKNVSWAEVHDM